MGTTKQELADDVGALKNFQLGPSIFFFLFQAELWLFKLSWQKVSDSIGCWVKSCPWEMT